jgi:CheY-like chemotaxis protein
VAGDAAELREAMTNLILNAVDAMPQGGVLRLDTAVAGDTVELTVADTGVGIPPTLREKIFDPFFTTKGPQGTGLGLSMTYGILSRHGARITVDSEEGQGSTFRIVYPRGEATEPPPPAPAAEPPGASPLRCLVVDDEPAVASVLGDVLEASGHRVVVLTDGADAVERLKQETFDVVFTDLAMPRVSGWDVARAAKAVAPDLPVFLVTGFGVELSAAERRVHGIEAVFSKPLRVEDITQAMTRVHRHTGATHVSEGDG